MWIANTWDSYALLDAASGEKLERYAGVTLVRPDPCVIWNKKSAPALWDSADAVYHRSKSGGGAWRFNKKLDTWRIKYGELTFNIKPFGFKHTGVFPEQAVNWDWFAPLIRRVDRPLRVLNLFAYTGGATIAAAKAGASVCHVDASKGMVAWAKDNARDSNLADAPIRYIVDDCIKFVKRESRRGARYDAIIMDPPSYGRGPGGEVFKIEDELYGLVSMCAELMSDTPLFFLINCYTALIGPAMLENVLKLTLGKRFGGTINADEIGLPIGQSGLILPCGVSGRFTIDN